jgi:hypothetical protein
LLRALRAGEVRLGVERLEDRVIPGETLNAILFWQMGFFPIRDLIGAPSVGEEGSPFDGVRLGRHDDAVAAARADEEMWTVSVPQSDLTVGEGEMPSETARAKRSDDDAGVPSDEVQTNSLIWSTDVADPANRQAPNVDMPAPPSGAEAAPSPVAWSPPVLGESTSPAVNGLDVVPIAPESAMQLSPAAGSPAVAQPAGNPHGGGGSPAGYSPAQMRHAYGFDQLTNDGAGQTIAIVDAFDAPTIASDLDTFSRQFGLPTTTSGLFTFSKVYAQGSRPSANGSWAQEVSLDVQWAHAIAPRANIMLVETASASAGNLFGGVDYAVAQGAHIVSMSWGFLDSQLGTAELGFDSHFNVPGVTFFASSGDTGSQVDYPSASRYVVSVGGTHLPLDASGNLTGAETAWSSGGGGVSIAEPQPGYQTTYGLSYSGRATPDVSYNADPNTGIAVYDSTRYLNMVGWLVAGGTSAGAPQWAGLVALVDQGRQGRATPLSSADLTTSPFYTAATASGNYRYIIAGSNGYSAMSGYDLATGVGSPLAGSLVPFLIAL